MRTRIAARLAAGLAATLALAGCAAAGASGAATGTANVGLDTDPSTFDPALGKAYADYNLHRLLFDTLVRRDTNGLVGGLASSWRTVSASEYAFTVRGGATCSDGTPITATVVAKSLARFTDPKTASPGRTLATGGASTTVTPDDAASTVTIKLSKPWADLPAGLSLPQSGIVCPAGLADPKGLAKGTVKGAFSGPYTVTSSSPAVRYELAFRPGYTAWPAFAKPLEGTAPRKIVLTPYSDTTTRATQLLSGAIDIASLTDENVARFENNPSFTTTTVNQLGTYLVFNERPGSIFADHPELRGAVAQAIDPQAFSDVLTYGRGKVMTSVGTPSLECLSTDTSLLPRHDQDAAKKVLSGLKIRLVGTVNLLQGNEYLAEVLRNAGADVKVSSLDNANWSTVTSKNGDWDVTLQGDLNIVGTLASSLLRVMGPAAEKGGRNKVGVTDDEGYAALQRAMTLTDPARRCGALQDAQKAALQRVDAFPLSTTPETAIAAEGFSLRTFGDYIDPATIRITGSPS